MSAAIFNGTAVKILKDILKFKDGTEISSTDATNTVKNTSTSTDNAIARFDSTTGKLVQNSGVTIDDSDNVIIPGNLTVNGTTTTFNTTTLDVEDANITVNKNGNQATADASDAGFTVEMSDATHATIHYDSTTTSKFKIGNVGSTVEVADISSSQSFSNKGINADNNILSNIANANIKSAAAIALNKLAATTASRALVSDASGFVTAATTTSTEIGYVNGVTSAIQTQINSKIAITEVFSVLSSSGTFTATSNSTHLVDTSGGAASITLPAVSLSRFVHIKDKGNAEANNITITPASGTIDGSASLVISSNYGSVMLVSDGTNWFII